MGPPLYRGPPFLHYNSFGENLSVTTFQQGYNQPA